MKNMETITEARRAAVAASIRSINAREMSALGETLFPSPDDPWRQTFFDFLAQHPHGSFYHAKAGDGVEILYCHEADKGLWFVPKSGTGPLQATGRKLMNEAIVGGAAARPPE